MKKLRILSIDGGGIRGILPGMILSYIESELRNKSGKKDAKISDYFDFIVGTSTGGILTCAYVCPDANGNAKYSAADAVGLYIEHGQEIFNRTLRQRITSGNGVLDEKYSAAALMSTLYKYFGEVTIQDAVKPCMVTAYDLENRKAHFFRSYPKGEDMTNFKLVDVARSTSAAPTYFECHRAYSTYGAPYTLVDGGVFANNPAMCAYSDARNFEGNPTAKDMTIISIGTGSSSKPYTYTKAKDFGMIEWLKPIIDILMSGNSETVDYQMCQMFDAADSEDHYIRINPRLYASDESMDNASSHNIKNLMEDGKRNVSEMKDTLDRVVELLIH